MFVSIFHVADRRQIERGARLLLELPDAGTVHIEPQPDAVLAPRIGQFADEIAFGGPARLQFLPALDRRRAGRVAVLDRPVQLARPAIRHHDRMSPRLTSSHYCATRMPSSA